MQEERGERNMNGSQEKKSRVVFFQNIYNYRKKCGMTQSQLSKRTQIHRTHISCLEQGMANPSLDTIIRLAEAFGVEPWRLLYDNGVGYDGPVRKPQRRKSI